MATSIWNYMEVFSTSVKKAFDILEDKMIAKMTTLSSLGAFDAIKLTWHT